MIKSILEALSLEMQTNGKTWIKSANFIKM
jgi:hypothetical protein